MWIVDKIKKMFNRSTMASTVEGSVSTPRPTTGRGAQVYSTSELIRIIAKDKFGQNLSTEIQIDFSQNDPLTCLTVFQKCSPIFGLITGRANKVSSTEWHIVPKKKIEDKLALKLKDCYSMFNEFDGQDRYSLNKRVQCLREIYRYIPDIKPDLSNFDRALYRVTKEWKSKVADKCKEIEDFYSQPSPGLSMADFLKQGVQDLLVHGSMSVYKQEHGRGNMYLLPGGSCFPIRSKYVGVTEAYIQMLSTLEEVSIFHPDEIAYAQYMPNSATAYGMKPIDAVINLVTEMLLFEQSSKDKADGLIPPEKLVVFGDQRTGFEDLTPQTDPLNKDEQRRIENKLNRPVKDQAIATLTGYGTPLLVDLSKADTYPNLMTRQDQLNKFFAMAWNASNNEINDTGTNGTSGRSTSETNERNDNSKGVRPQYVTFEDLFTHKTIPQKYGTLYQYEFLESMSDEEKVNLAKLKKDSGLYTVNEIRINDLNEEPLSEEELTQLQGVTPQQQGNELLQQIQESIKNGR